MILENRLPIGNLPATAFCTLRGVLVRMSLVTRLPKFRAWFVEFDARVWDEQIDADAKAGNLDRLLAEALADYKAGKAREL